MIYLSTSSPENLSQNNSDLIFFQRPEPGDYGFLGILQNQNKWFVGSKSGCSCTFRHLLSVELGFSEPQDWAPEDDAAVQATAEFYRIIARLVTAGNRVDCVDLWQDAQTGSIKSQVVDLNVVSEKSFLFFENYHFVFELNPVAGQTRMTNP